MVYKQEVNTKMSADGMLLTALVILVLCGCSPDLSDDPMPYQPFDDIVINTSLPSYNALRTDGGYVYLSEGVRGIILYRESASVYYAFERTCTFQPASACATVEVDVSTFFTRDPCCSSTFSFRGGVPENGPAWRPLQQYNVTLSSGVLTVTDEVVN